MSDFEKEFKKKLDVKFLPRDINKCRLDYVIEKKKDLNNGVIKTEIRPSLICKGLGWVAGKEIEKNQPFEGLKDFAERNSSAVDTVVGTNILARGVARQKGKVSTVISAIVTAPTLNLAGGLVDEFQGADDVVSSIEQMKKINTLSEPILRVASNEKKSQLL